MNFQLVPVTSSGNLQTFSCVECGVRIHQRQPWQQPANCVCIGNDMHGQVWADLDGEPFKDYYCWWCKKLKEKQ